MTIDQPRDDNPFDAKTEALLAELGQLADRKGRQSKWIRPVVFSCYAYIFGYTVYGLSLPVPVAYRAMLQLLFCIALVVVSAIRKPGDVMPWKYERLETLVCELSGDARAVGAFAQLCLPTLDRSIADIANKTLLTLLPCVKAGDARYISENQMQALLDLLAVRREELGTLRPSKELPLAILKALEQIGDSRVIGPVRCLTTGWVNRRYHQAARECLAVLEQHGEEWEHNRSLLLPSSVEAGKETLLRAAIPQSETQTEQLLWAATGEERG